MCLLYLFWVGIGDGFFNMYFTVDSGGAGGARAPQVFGGSEKGQRLITAYQSLAITTNTPGFKKLSTALHLSIKPKNNKPLYYFRGLSIYCLNAVLTS